MSLRSWLPLVAVMLAMVCASVAQAASTDIVTMADGTCWNVASHQKVDCTTGKVLALVDDASRDREFTRYTVGISDTTGCASADSTNAAGPWYTGNLKRMWLHIVVTWPNAALVDSAGPKSKWCRFAVQTRGSIVSASDSVNVAPWYVYTDSTRTKSFPGGPISVADDTLGYRMPTYTYGAAIPNTTLLPTELLFFASRPTSLGSANNVWGETTNFYIPLADDRGVYFWAPYTSIRLRTLNNYSYAPANQPKYVVTLVGTAL